MRVSALCFVLSFFLLGCEAKPPQTAQDVQKAVQQPALETTASPQIAEAPQVPSEQIPSPESFSPFYVYKDVGSRENHYVPSGFMPNGKCINFNDRWQESCNSGSTCIRIEYDLECSRADQRWAGIYWMNPPNNWGQRKGGFNLQGATKLTFWARGEQGGEQIEEFTIGGITGDYPDTDKVVMGPVILSNQWKKYTIDLRGKDLSYISGGFAWSTNEEVNGETCIFYLDDIQYE
jgi:hypothetical protein